MIPTRLHTAWRVPVFTALIGSIIVGGLSTLILDGGRIARVVAAALLVVWLVNCVLITRAHEKPKASDLLFVRYGWRSACSDFLSRRCVI